jgi:predicted amino acid dehydrogenase
MQTLMDGKPIRLFSKHLMNGKIHFTFYILPFDTAHLEMIHRFGKKRYYIARIQEAVDGMISEGVTHISLGAHTSILSGNGLYLAESQKAKILTGNTLTVASCLYHTAQYFKTISRNNKRATIAITGAGGNVGSGLAACFSDEKYEEAKIILIGNGMKKLQLLRKKIFADERLVTCTTDLFQLKKADIIISCTNTNDPLIFSHHIDAAKKVFVIDIAVPGAVAEEVKQQRNVIYCKEASTVSLPDDPEFVISSHTAPGKIFCCAAEALLAAMYDVKLPLKGHVRAESIKKMLELAAYENMFNRKEYAPVI